MDPDSPQSWFWIIDALVIQPEMFPGSLRASIESTLARLKEEDIPVTSASAPEILSSDVLERIRNIVFSTEELGDIDDLKTKFFNSCASQEGTCVRCKSHGELLICNGENCPIAIHSRCLNGAPYFEEGHFYCPFCASSFAFFDFLKSKEKISKSRNDLRRFIEGARVGEEDGALSMGMQELEIDDEYEGDDDDKEGDEEDGEGDDDDEEGDEEDEEGDDGDEEGDEDDEEEDEDEVHVAQAPAQDHALRRMPVYWNDEETAALRAGVERFGHKWKEILHDGAGIFKSTRTPVDLKDKWRNVLKAEAKAKGK